MLTAWGDSTEEEEGSEEEEEAVALKARSVTDSDEEPNESLDRLKNKVCGSNKAKLKEFLFTLMDECDACAKGKQVKNSLKSKRCVSTSRPLEMLHIDLYGPMRIMSRRGKR